MGREYILESEAKMAQVKTERSQENNIQIHLAFFGMKDDVHSVVKDWPQPYTALNQGERNPTRNIPRASLIVYRSKTPKWDDSFDTHWQELYGRLSGIEQPLIKLSQNCDRIDCTIVVDYVGRFPILIFPADFIAFLDSINARLEIDVLDDR